MQDMPWQEALKQAPFIRLSRISVGGAIGCVIGLISHANASLTESAAFWNFLVLLLLCLVLCATFIPATWASAKRIASGQPLAPKRALYLGMGLRLGLSSLIAVGVFLGIDAMF